MDCRTPRLAVRSTPRLGSPTLAANLGAHAVPRFISAQWLLADALALEMVLDELVGIHLGCIARQKVRLKVTTILLGYGSGLWWMLRHESWRILVPAVGLLGIALEN